MGEQRRRYVVSAIRGPGRIRAPRGRTLLGGVLLGGALVLALFLAGVVGEVPRVAADPPVGQWATAGPDPLTARQPELTGALLQSADLPKRHPAAPPADPSPTPTMPAARPTATPPAPERGKAGPTDRLCRDLFERPWDLAARAARPLDRAVVDLSEERRGTTLRQTLTVFAGDGASVAVRRLAELSGRCREFGATLDDGTRLRVRSREVAIPHVGDETYALLFSARAGQRTYAGFLAVGRIGPLVTVLRYVGPAGSVEAEDAAAMLRRSLEKAGPFARERD